MKHKLSILFLTLFITACIAAGMALRGPEATLLVENLTGSHVRVYVDGRWAGTVTGIIDCIYFDHLQQGFNLITFKETGRPAYPAPEVPLNTSEGWFIRLAQQPRFDVLSLQTYASCTKGSGK